MLHPEPDGSRGSKLFGLVLALMGLIVCGMIARDTCRAWQSRHWPDVPCTILASAVEEQNGERPYRLHFLYRYQWRGQQHIGQTLRRDAQDSSNIADIERLVRAYPKDARRICFVDPDNPSVAALERESVREGIAVVVLFATLIALLGRLYILPGRPPGERATLGERTLGKPTAFLLCLLVASVGIICFAWMTALPIRKSIVAIGWVRTPCTVASSQVRKKVLGGEYQVMTWWPDVVFRYRVNGRDYRANTVSFTDLPTPWYYGERGIAARYRQGAAATCFVNPKDPFEAVLIRQPSLDLWFGVWPLIMALIGTRGMIESASNRKIRFGRSEDWGKLALWAATYFALLVLQATGSDLVRDVRAGMVEWLEIGAVSLVGLAAAIPVAALIGLSSRKRLAVQPLAPGHRGIIEIDDFGLTRRFGEDNVERVAWDDLAEVAIVTTDDGPFVEDVFWLLVGRHGDGCVISQEAPEFGKLLERLQRLPGFDNRALIEAMGSAHNARIVCWRSPKG